MTNYTVQIREIKRLCAELFGVTVKDMDSKNRRHTVSKARSVAMWLIRHRLGMSYTEVSRVFKFDHSTAIYAVRRVESIKTLRDCADSLSNKLDKEDV